MKRSKIFVTTMGLSIVSLIALSGCGSNTNNAQQQPTGAANNGTHQQGPHGGRNGLGGGAQYASVAKVLNLPQSTLMNDLKNGESIAEIAQKQGISQQTLISNLESSYKSQLDQAVTNGRITTDQEQQMISRYNQNLPNMIQRKGLPTFNGRGGNRNGGQAWNNTSGANNTV